MSYQMISSMDDGKEISCMTCLNPVAVSLSNTHDLQLDGKDDEKRLHVTLIDCPTCKKTVGVEVQDKFLSLDESLKSNVPTRHGMTEVETCWERLMLYILCQVIYNQYERQENDTVFHFPTIHDTAKLIWLDGIAVGCYTLKSQGQPYTDAIYAVYQLPVVDLVFVKQSARRQGLGIAVIENVVSAFPGQDVGISCPLSAAMRSVLKKYLTTHRQQRRRLWATTYTGCEGHRSNIWLMLKQRSRSENM